VPEEICVAKKTARRESAPHSDERKLKQLAREAYRILSQALGELADPRLESAFLVEVRPAPDAGRLAARVSAGMRATVSQVEAALEAARGHLRGELATGLARKRTPDLLFEVVP
jgi:ribosome-binding factor A